MKPRNTRLESLSIVAALCALSAWLSGCTSDDLTLDEACREQATVWCDRTHDNASCRTGYYFTCTPPGSDRGAAVDVTAQNTCLDEIVLVTPFKDTRPASCIRLWGASR